MEDRTPAPPVRRRRAKAEPRQRTQGTPLGDWIRKRRELQGISQRELADRAGISRSYLCDIERGRGTKPSVESLDSLSTALGADRIELLRVAGILEPVRGPEESSRERRLLAVYRALNPANQEAIERYARFVLSEEQRWVQATLVDGEMAGSERPGHRGPMLFDLAEL
jgi:transcriptional regulator with XRE-family HTH domain